MCINFSVLNLQVLTPISWFFSLLTFIFKAKSLINKQIGNYPLQHSLDMYVFRLNTILSIVKQEKGEVLEFLYIF